MSDVKPKQTRKPRFSADESCVLVSEYTRLKNTLESKFSDTMNLKKKNSVNPSVIRTVPEIKKK